MTASEQDHKLDKTQRRTALDTARENKKLRRTSRATKQITKLNAVKADFTQLPGFEDMQLQRMAAELLNIENPFFRAHEARAGATTVIAGDEKINFSSYDYLGLNGHPDVMDAARQGIETYGISAGASRVVGGERPAHKMLEMKIASLYSTEDAVVFVSGHATNVSTLGKVLQPDDLVLHDSFIHNSILTGIKLSGANRQAFPHNDLDALERLLSSGATQHNNVLVVIEGIYSMDGDYPDLPRILELKQKYKFWLMVDEAHSLGTLGKTGRGLAEYFDIDPSNVDIWMGTCSKTLAGCGGYIAGSQDLIDYLKFSTAGFVFSVGLPPLLACSISKAIDIMLDEPERVTRAQENGRYFLNAMNEAGFDTGHSMGYAVVPMMLGDSIKAVFMASQLLTEGINALPIIHPAVPEKSARLRFFITSEHTREQLDFAVEAIKKVNNEYDNNPIDLNILLS